MWSAWVVCEEEYPRRMDESISQLVLAPGHPAPPLGTFPGALTSAAPGRGGTLSLLLQLFGPTLSIHGPRGLRLLSLLKDRRQTGKRDVERRLSPANWLSAFRMHHWGFISVTRGAILGRGGMVSILRIITHVGNTSSSHAAPYRLLHVSY